MSQRSNPRQGLTYAQSKRLVRALGGDEKAFRARMGKRHTYNTARVLDSVQS